MKRTAHLYLAVAALAIVSLVASCSGEKKGPSGTTLNPIKFYFMPLKGENIFAEIAPKFAKFMEANAGLAIEPIYAKDFLTMIEAFGNKRADAGFMNTLGYLMAHDWAGAQAYLRTMYGDVYETYKGEIIVRADGKINTLGDIAGKTIAFADPFSASGYLYAQKLLTDKNIKPKKVIFAKGHAEAVEMLYKGEVDAAATYHTRPSNDGGDRDARIELIKKYPDVVSKLKIIALTDDIPNGPVAFAKGLPDDVKAKLAGAIIAYARTEEGRDAFIKLYNITGFAMGKDSDYDGVRKVLKELGKTSEEMVPGGITFYKVHAIDWMGY